MLRALLDQPGTTRAVATVSFLLLIGGLIGWIAGWPYYLRVLEWGVVWAIVALAAWAMHR